jgi:acetyl esterase
VLDKDIKAFFGGQAKLELPSGLNATPIQMRSRYWIETGLFRDALPPEIWMRDAFFEGKDRRIRARVFVNRNDESSVPTIVFYHGGGWVLGDVESYSPLCAQLAQATGARVVSIDYPLAPQHDWREITDYCLDAFGAVATHFVTNSLTSKLAIVGDSAGGHLASVTAIRARDEYPSYSIALQVLMYPCIDPACSTQSFQEFENGPGLTKRDMQRYWRFYAGADLVLEDLRISPLRAQNLRGLPPTFIVTAGCDPLRDDGRLYADALRRDGVSVERLDCATMPHGFLGMGLHSGAARDAATQIGHRVGMLLACV